MVAAAAIALMAPANASVLYDSGTFNNPTCPATTDGCVAPPPSATASFSLSGDQLTVVLTNTTSDPWQTSENLSAFSFELQNFGGSFFTATLTSITGQELATMPALGHAVSPGSSTNLTTTTPWSTTHGGTSMNTGGNFQSFFAGGVGGMPGSGADSIVGSPTSLSAGYSAGTCSMALGPNSGCGSSDEFGTVAGDSPNIFETATFVFTLNGTPDSILANTSTCATGDACLSNIQFGFGPDGPDMDDVTNGSLATGGTGTAGNVPEPSALVIMAAGLLGLGYLMRRRRSA